MSHATSSRAPLILQSVAAASRRAPLAILVGEACQGLGEVQIEQIEQLGSGAGLTSFEAPVEFIYGDSGDAGLVASCTGHASGVSTHQHAAGEAFRRCAAAAVPLKKGRRGR